MTVRMDMIAERPERPILTLIAREDRIRTIMPGIEVREPMVLEVYTAVPA